MIEISISTENNEEPQHFGYYDTIDEAIGALNNLKSNTELREFFGETDNDSLKDNARLMEELEKVERLSNEMQEVINNIRYIV